MPFAVKHEKFEGPLDFLLQEIEKEKLSINEVSLAKITDNFLVYIQSLPKAVQYEIAEFLVVAARLLLIKSRSLLPALQLTDEEELSIEELENRLKVLQKIRERAEELGRIEKNAKRLYARESFHGMEAIFYPPKDLTIERVAEVFQEVLMAIPKPKKLQEEEMKKVVSLEEKIAELQESLKIRTERLFSEFIKGSKDKVEIIVNFLAILELARKKLIRLDQSEAFGDITIQRQEN